MNGSSKPAPPFRIGQGYVSHWLHELEHHCTLTEKELVSVRDFALSLRTLIRYRNALESARRALIPVGSLDVSTTPSNADQRTLFDTTQAFFQQFYATVSALAGLAKRFPQDFGSVPHASNERFIEWLSREGMYSEMFDLLRSSRDFRAIVDHKAANQPCEWGTTGASARYRAFMHGGVGETGNLPRGATRAVPEHKLPSDWFFLAPDEDLVLFLLAVQLNFVVPRIAHSHWRPESMPCRWQLPIEQGDPVGGYPILASGAGTVLATGTMTPELSPEDQSAVGAILGKYQSQYRDEATPDA